MLRVIAWIITVVIFALLLVFAYNNLNGATLRFLSASATLPMIVWVLIIFAAGCLTGMMAMLPFAYKRRKQAKKAVQQAQVVKEG